MFISSVRRQIETFENVCLKSNQILKPPELETYHHFVYFYIRKINRIIIRLYMLWECIFSLFALHK